MCPGSCASRSTGLCSPRTPVDSSMLPPGNGKPAFIPGLQIRQLNDRYLQICILNNPLVSFDLYFNIRHVLRTFQSARPMGGVPPGDAHGGNEAGIHVLRRLEGRDKSVSFGEYPGPLCRSQTLARRNGAGRAGECPLRRRIHNLSAYAVR